MRSELIGVPQPAHRTAVDWLVLATDGPALDLPRLVPHLAIQVVPTSVLFESLLITGRPQVAIVSDPPADEAGIAYLAQVRRGRASLLTVYLTRPQAVSERLDALKLGLDDALPSTMNADELAGRLRLLSARRASERMATPNLPIGRNLTLDTDAHVLRRDGQSVALRPREFQLLELLATNPGRAFTRRELLGRMQARLHEAEDRTVDVHVRWLRSKIEDHPESPRYLVTVRGVGYRLDPNFDREAVASPG